MLLSWSWKSIGLGGTPSGRQGPCFRPRFCDTQRTISHDFAPLQRPQPERAELLKLLELLIVDHRCRHCDFQTSFTIATTRHGLPTPIPQPPTLHRRFPSLSPKNPHRHLFSKPLLPGSKHPLTPLSVVLPQASFAGDRTTLPGPK